MKATYKQIYENEGFTVKSKVMTRWACCDCGLIHDLVFVSGRKGSLIGVASSRNKRATAGRRRGDEEMSDQVVMSITNAQLAIAVPLFRFHHEEKLAKFEGYSLSLTSSKPLAFVLDCGAVGCQVVNAEFAYKHLEFLGDL